MSYERITDNLEEMVAILPPYVLQPLSTHPQLSELLEVILDLGRLPEARFPEGFDFLSQQPVALADIEYVTSRIGEFGRDNRAGIERTLHRISCIRNRHGRIVGLTCRVGRAVFGTIDIIRDIVEANKSTLLLGRPGVGKTTKLREVARVLNDDFGKRVVVVDTSNEIGGDGDIPHPAIGRARRMQVPSPDRQHDVMIEAVENHMPEVIVIDEIGTSLEAFAARTIAERGVQLIATAHGNTLDNLLMNPTLSDLIGGVQAVTLSDEEAKRRRTQKTVLERKAPPTFDTVIEIVEKDRLAVHHDVAQVVDDMLRGKPPRPELRYRDAEGKVSKEFAPPSEGRLELEVPPSEIPPPHIAPRRPKRIFSYGISRSKLEKAATALRLPGIFTKHPSDAEYVMTLASHVNKFGSGRQGIPGDVPLLVARSNTFAQILACLREAFAGEVVGPEEEALREAQEAVQKVLTGNRPVELRPQNAYIRRLQHELASRYHLNSQSVGKEPRRRVQIFSES